MSDRETTAALQNALMKAFPLPEYATFFEVGDATGGRHSRWADAVSMSCWPSRGLRIYGFEVKASRSDWLREKKKPQKSGAVQRYCHHWVLVTAPDVVHDGELPPTWGHMVLASGRLRTEVAPPLLEPTPLEAPFVAAMLRRCGQVSAEQVSVAVREATDLAREVAKVEAKREFQRRLARSGKAQQAVEQFLALRHGNRPLGLRRTSSRPRLRRVHESAWRSQESPCLQHIGQGAAGGCRRHRGRGGGSECGRHPFAR